jgi:hypothetical protein
MPKVTDKSRNVTHTATIAVVENIPPRMYLRQEIGNGEADDGTPITVDSTGGTIIISLGTYPEGRQFLVNISQLTKDVLKAVTP